MAVDDLKIDLLLSRAKIKKSQIKELSIFSEKAFEIELVKTWVIILQIQSILVYCSLAPYLLRLLARHFHQVKTDRTATQ